MGNVVEGVSQYSGDGALCWPEEEVAEALSITTVVCNLILHLK